MPDTYTPPQAASHSRVHLGPTLGRMHRQLGPKAEGVTARYLVLCINVHTSQYLRFNQALHKAYHSSLYASIEQREEILLDLPWFFVACFLDSSTGYFSSTKEKFPNKNPNEGIDQKLGKGIIFLQSAIICPTKRIALLIESLIPCFSLNSSLSNPDADQKIAKLN